MEFVLFSLPLEGWSRLSQYTEIIKYILYKEIKVSSTNSLLYTISPNLKQYARVLFQAEYKISDVCKDFVLVLLTEQR